MDSYRVCWSKWPWESSKSGLRLDKTWEYPPKFYVFSLEHEQLCFNKLEINRDLRMNWTQLCSSVSSSGSTPLTSRLTTSRQTTRWEHTTPNNAYQGVHLLKTQDDLLATPLIDPRPVRGPANVVNTLIYLVHVDVL